MKMKGSQAAVQTRPALLRRKKKNFISCSSLSYRRALVADDEGIAGLDLLVVDGIKGFHFRVVAAGWTAEAWDVLA